MSIAPKQIVEAQARREREAAAHAQAERERAEHLAQMEAEDKTPDGVPKDWFRHTHFVKYDPATGAILQAGVMSKAAIELHQSQDGGHYLHQEGSLHGHYVDVSCAGHTVCAKCEAPIEVDGTTLRNLPIPCRVTVEVAGHRETIDCTDPNDPVLELSFDLPGTYQVTVKAVRHHPKTITITV